MFHSVPPFSEFSGFLNFLILFAPTFAFKIYDYVLYERGSSYEGLRKKYPKFWFIGFWDRNRCPHGFSSLRFFGR